MQEHITDFLKPKCLNNSQLLVSYSEFCIVSVWKAKNPVSKLKKGEKYKASNYRPVYLTCVLCKCVEHIVASQVMQHLTKKNILYNHQHGFRSKLSTETQLIEFTKDMLRGMKDG